MEISSGSHAQILDPDAKGSDAVESCSLSGSDQGFRPAQEAGVKSMQTSNHLPVDYEEQVLSTAQYNTNIMIRGTMKTSGVKLLGMHHDPS